MYTYLVKYRSILIYKCYLVVEPSMHEIVHVGRDAVNGPRDAVLIHAVGGAEVNGGDHLETRYLVNTHIHTQQTKTQTAHTHTHTNISGQHTYTQQTNGG